MIVLQKGAYHYRAICQCSTQAITDSPLDRVCPYCGDLMVVFELEKPLKMAFVEAYDYKLEQNEGGKL